MILFLQLALLLSIIFLPAKMVGYLSTRFGQPFVLGELLVGVILGSSIVHLINFSFIEHGLAETIAKLGELGILLLMFLVAFELHLGEMEKSACGCFCWIDRCVLACIIKEEVVIEKPVAATTYRWIFKYLWNRHASCFAGF